MKNYRFILFDHFIRYVRWKFERHIIDAIAYKNHLPKTDNNNRLITLAGGF